MQAHDQHRNNRVFISLSRVAFASHFTSDAWKKKRVAAANKRFPARLSDISCRRVTTREKAAAVSSQPVVAASAPPPGDTTSRQESPSSRFFVPFARYSFVPTAYLGFLMELMLPLVNSTFPGQFIFRAREVKVRAGEGGRTRREALTDG